MVEFQEIKELVKDGEWYTAKKIRICDMPDCDRKRTLLEMVVSPDVTIWVVGKPGNKLVGDWTVYTGHPKFDNWKDKQKKYMLPYFFQGLSTPEGTCAYGDKLFDLEAAKELFPEYADLTYRF